MFNPNERVEDTTAKPDAIGRAERDVVALGIVTAAILLFVGTGSAVVGRSLSAWLGNGPQPDRLLGVTVLLNIALIIFGWRRYRELTHEVGERRKAEATANHLAQVDPLTECLNRRSTGPAVSALIASAAERGHRVATLMIDLDKFKAVNDIHGHSAGDMMLVQTARRISSLLPAGAALARLGGDEFACLVAFDPARRETVDRLAERMIEAVSEPIDLSGTRLETSASIGLASSEVLAPGCADPAAELLHMADIAMYQAKKRGRSRYFWYDPGMERELRFRSDLECAIRRGIVQDEFVPYYEKQIDLATGEITGFEMLARWKSADYGLVSPEVFIPVAEEIGVIAELSEKLIRQAMADAREWDPQLTLSVNISPIQLRDPWFAQKLLKIMVEANFPPSRLDIEITEGSLHENIGVVRSLVTSLRNQGVGISLDDFGTGYSSLAQLRSLPFDRIKIDRSFVSTLGSSPDSATIIKAIASLGEGMNLPITAEGIETVQVLNELQHFGQFKGQGFLYGQPQSAADVHTMLGAQNLLARSLAKPDANDAPPADHTPDNRATG